MALPSFLTGQGPLLPACQRTSLTTGYLTRGFVASWSIWSIRRRKSPSQPGELVQPWRRGQSSPVSGPIGGVISVWLAIISAFLFHFLFFCRSFVSHRIYQPARGPYLRDAILQLETHRQECPGLRSTITRHMERRAAAAWSKRDQTGWRSPRNARSFLRMCLIIRHGHRSNRERVSKE
ncbi:hypothetical protein CDEST_06469 [Colletotrichum destructivum]|uniref:Uncharacterized protein n=1 Tax=Colletotrichum destructivum TaxID=34406 RepID=A0AAX4IDU7_9PEZI|nr:hypothetical protein CDEST_06469 [Colletotrichum destructivum]